ncbi:baseplate multidomain protein megatron [Paenirhodobacter sp.]|uniref:baseplate multidomain protein megatron n=1 Tax=Paenirhodobacter sp. TaxID=1965326 RepID=UPI003B3E45C3
MATILLSAAGGAIGAGFGGTILGLSGAVMGRAVGAVLGRAIDQRLLGSGSQSVETGRVERFRLTSASEGDGVGILWGRMRVSGQIIWATRFFETKSVQKSGKGTSQRVTTTSYSYSVSLAIALCEGEILRVGRVWADGTEIDRSALNMRVYTGSEAQQPDPKIEAVEGLGMAPSYRGIAYVVIEDLELGAFGNRVPQFNFEVVRAAQGAGADTVPDLVRGVKAVALIPGTGEYSLATTPVYERQRDSKLAKSVAVNQNAPGGVTDFRASLTMLEEELPECGSVSLVVSWFGNDLRCGQCEIRPKVADKTVDGTNMPWRVSGLGRADALEIPKLGEKGSVYGGTPSDASVIESIRALRAAGKDVVFYPFILMEQMQGNTLPDPWTGAEGQPPLPWRGRITLSMAPGREGSPDGTAAAAHEVAAFFGMAQPSQFSSAKDTVSYSGPEEWSMRRFILHYAHLCALAGGVDAFCIGTEMVALTQIRGANNRFPSVDALRKLAAEVRSILGPDCKIGYAADWSEYFGYHPGNGDVFFHLDPLWADKNIDFIGIDNYMPLSDWRDGEEHLDAHWGAIYNLDYLKSNIEGGEGYDWYYALDEHRDAQVRTPITDGYDEPWVWRYKDIRNWWSHLHHDRMNGVRKDAPTDWIPGSKPIWFTELGCAAVNKGTNQPNKFLDPKSSESSLPHFSDGRRDELIQMQYLRAMTDYWEREENNPVATLYNGRMLDTRRMHVWAWDARPYPQFPQLGNIWADGENYARGHWISGRVSSQPLASVVGEICARSDVTEIDTSALYGLVRGFTMTGGQTARSALQTLILAYGFEALERNGKIVFRMRDGRVDAHIPIDRLVVSDEHAVLEYMRSPDVDTAGRMRIAYIEADGDFETRAVEAIFPDEEGNAAAGSELPLTLTRSQAQGTAERWLSEARVARDGAKFALPPSLGMFGAGDVLALPMEEGVRRYRVDRTERSDALSVEAVRVEPSVYEPSDEAEDIPTPKPYSAPVPVTPVFMDLPLMTGNEDPISPHLAVSVNPWPGAVAVYSSVEDDGYALNHTLSTRASIGVTLSPLLAAQPGLWDRGAPLRVQMEYGTLESVSDMRLLNGANLLAIGDGASENWELLQFMDAVPVSKNIWDISLRLRGQLGTDAKMPDVWPEGSRIVLMDGAVEQVQMPASTRGLARHFRVGSARNPYDDASYVHVVESFKGSGLRPLSPCHLRSAVSSEGVSFKWVRRTRIDGDSWEGLDVPLGEANESYRIRILKGTEEIRQMVVTSPRWVYDPVMMALDGISESFDIEVAQISETYGIGAMNLKKVIL